MILKIYALSWDKGLKLYELNADLLRFATATVAGDNIPSTVHWNRKDAENLLRRIEDKSGSANFTMRIVQVDSLAKLAEMEIESDNIPEYSIFELPTKEA